MRDADWFVKTTEIVQVTKSLLSDYCMTFKYLK